MLAGSRALSLQRRHLLCHPQFLLTWQALELTFCSQCLSFAVERPGSNERDRTMGLGVASSLSSIVQSNTSLDVGGIPRAERPINAADHVDLMCLRIIHTPLLTPLHCPL